MPVPTVIPHLVGDTCARALEAAIRNPIGVKDRSWYEREAWRFDRR